ncbi:MAG: hypothetical protein M0R06_16265 [Sphaerochaeta sp.]|jgi:hypothetical protein|nr:hypothetical protein [Sphaerochaeta sp.]
MNAHKLKSLETEITSVTDEMKLAKMTMTEATAAYSKLKLRHDSLIQQVGDLKKEPIVSEHAMLRYLEKQFSLNPAEIQDRIFDKVRDLCEKLDWCDGSYPMGDGHKAIVKNKTIVTIK